MDSIGNLTLLNSSINRSYQNAIFPIKRKKIINLDIDSIGNLTLLNSSINRSYQNAIFPIKRKKIINLDKTSIFVPLATKNVFLKYYSSHIYRMMEWNKHDSESYIESISEKLFIFFGDNI
ncbi:HNH endonuclease family protein [Acinetobacter bereziniae]|nr:HNH endonuclease family protein [Acinetobacter bereziniae]